MKTAAPAPVVWFVLVALADPVAAQIDTSSRLAVGETGIEVTEARKVQGLVPVTKGMRPSSGHLQLALATPQAKTRTAKRPEDEWSPKPNDIIIDVIVAYTK